LTSPNVIVAVIVSIININITVNRHIL